MPKRICDKCGKEKDMAGGKTCEKGHFICRACLDIGFFNDGISKCPICNTKLK